MWAQTMDAGSNRGPLRCFLDLGAVMTKTRDLTISTAARWVRPHICYAVIHVNI